MPQAELLAKEFESQRPRLLRLAYRMLGSLVEAEDVVQDAWIRWQEVELEQVEQPAAYLTRIVTRLCLDVMKSARVRRESYFGSWLPEPVLDDDASGIDDDDLTLTLMMALERLSPLERAAFLLHDVFGVPLDQVASTLHRESAAVRQLAVRARKHVQSARPRFPVPRDEGNRIVRAFIEASRAGDVAGLQSILAHDVVMMSDGGGKVLAFPKPIIGIERAVRLYQGLHRRFADRPTEVLEFAWIDGLPGYISRGPGDVLQTTAFEIEDGRITHIFITRNPDKLVRIAERVGYAG
ncbi:MAG: sigma-70 family RNA polymerase sigma factor [Gemmatimonas sp.]